MMKNAKMKFKQDRILKIESFLCYLLLVWPSRKWGKLILIKYLFLFRRILRWIWLLLIKFHHICVKVFHTLIKVQEHLNRSRLIWLQIFLLKSFKCRRMPSFKWWFQECRNVKQVLSCWDVITTKHKRCELRGGKLCEGSFPGDSRLRLRCLGCCEECRRGDQQRGCLHGE